MKLRMMILTGILVMAVSAGHSLQAAETDPVGEVKGMLASIFGEKGIADQLLGEGGLLENALPDGSDIEGMVSTLKEKLGEADSKIASVVGDIAEKVKEKTGSYDIDAIENYLAPIFDQFLGGDDGLGDFDFGVEELFNQGQRVDELVTDHILEMNTDILDSGDVQIVDPGTVYGDDIGNEEFKYLSYGMQYNYTEDDEHQLHLLCWKEDLILLTIHEEEDGSYTVLDAQVPEVDDYDEFLNDFCKEIDKTPEDCRESIGFTKAYFPYTLSLYMENHPEITGIEYDGAIRTVDELNEIGCDNLIAWCPPETEME